MAKPIKIPIAKGTTKKQLKALIAGKLEKHITTDMLGKSSAVAIHFQGVGDPGTEPIPTKPSKPKPPVA